MFFSFLVHLHLQDSKNIGVQKERRVEKINIAWGELYFYIVAVLIVCLFIVYICQ